MPTLPNSRAWARPGWDVTILKPRDGGRPLARSSTACSGRRTPPGVSLFRYRKTYGTEPGIAPLAPRPCPRSEEHLPWRPKDLRGPRSQIMGLLGPASGGLEDRLRFRPLLRTTPRRRRFPSPIRIAFAGQSPISGRANRGGSRTRARRDFVRLLDPHQPPGPKAEDHPSAAQAGVLST